MKQYIAAIAAVTIISILATISVNEITGNIVTEENPCRIVDCNVRVFGFWETKAEQIGTTPDGLAICHCPHEPIDRLYYISYTRKY